MSSGRNSRSVGGDAIAERLQDATEGWREIGEQLDAMEEGMGLGDTMDHDRSHYAIQDREEVLRRSPLTAGQLAELRAMVASEYAIPIVDKPVLAALLDAYETRNG